ncbi:ABC transporter substrate-binding protein [Botrimarina sp.]|uniref:ABC transporter substrate-binding protein n=1 Tax=Botrimarina sp. TaxID=2795802 RepID=UPI0032EE4C04
MPARCLALCLLLAAAAAGAAQPVTLALNWKAQPELGGFYQALAAGHYADAGLDVAIRLGGPQINNRPLLPTGRVDFLIGTNLLTAFDAAKQRIPTRVVAAMLQKDPQCLLSHADGPHATWDDLKRAPLLMGAPGRHSFFLWLESQHGFRRALLRPYNHSLAPFLVNKDWAVQGYVTAEPERIVEAGAPEPRVFLLADNGWGSYSTVLETRQELIDRQPGLVQAFVDASVLGWVEYLYGDRSDADRLILRDNRDMSQSQIDASVAMMRRRGLVDSGLALEQGIGAIDARRVGEFYRSMVDSGLFSEGDLDPADAFTTRFVNRGAGLARKAELLAADE